jgi:hypothetical protein
MLRFILHTIALTTLLVPIRELTVFQHFCHDKLIRSELFEKNTHQCCETTEESCDGCKNEEVTLAIDDFQSASTPTIVSATNLVLLVIHNTQLSIIEELRDHVLQPSINDPPVRSGKHRSILLQTFLL